MVGNLVCSSRGMVDDMGDDVDVDLYPLAEAWAMGGGRGVGAVDAVAGVAAASVVVLVGGSFVVSADDWVSLRRFCSSLRCWMSA